MDVVNKKLISLAPASPRTPIGTHSRAGSLGILSPGRTSLADIFDSPGSPNNSGSDSPFRPSAKSPVSALKDSTRLSPASPSLSALLPPPPAEWTIPGMAEITANWKEANTVTGNGKTVYYLFNSEGTPASPNTAVGALIKNYSPNYVRGYATFSDVCPKVYKMDGNTFVIIEWITDPLTITFNKFKETDLASSVKSTIAEFNPEQKAELKTSLAQIGALKYRFPNAQILISKSGRAYLICVDEKRPIQVGSFATNTPTFIALQECLMAT